MNAQLELPSQNAVHWNSVIEGVNLLGAEATMPAEFGLGLMRDDPLLPVVEALPDPRWLLEVLTESGWRSAKIPLQTDCPSCSQDRLLTSLAAKVEAYLSANMTEESFAREVTALCGCDEWSSISVPLESDGAWIVPDLSTRFGGMLGVPPTSVQQTPAPGIAVNGVGTVVIRGAVTAVGSSQSREARVVVSLLDTNAPQLTVALQSGGRPLPTTPLGIHYIVIPADVDVVANAIDIPVAQDLAVMVRLNGEPVGSRVGMQQPGYHSIEVTACDPFGNTTTFNDVIYAARRPLVEARFGIDSIEVLQDGQIEAVVRVWTEERDSRLICPRFVSMTVASTERQAAVMLSLPPEAGGGGSYDPYWARRDGAAWRLRLRGRSEDFSEDISSGSPTCFVSGRSFLIADEFDMLSGWSPFTESPQQLQSPPDGPGIGSHDGAGDHDGGGFVEPPCEWEIVRSCSFCLDSDQIPTTRYKVANSWARAGFFGPTSYAYAEALYDLLADVPGGNSNSAATMSSCGVHGTVSVKRKGSDCCTSCEIEVSANPRFTARAEIDPPASAAAAARVKISTPCGSADATGGVALSSFGNNSVQVGVGGWSVVLPVEAGTERDRMDFGDALLCTVPSCEVTVIYYTSAYAAARAHPSAFDWRADGIAGIRNGTLGLSFKAKETCTGGGAVPTPLPTFEDGGWWFE